MVGRAPRNERSLWWLGEQFVPRRRGEHARTVVEDLCLTVVASNAAARRLYSSVGFKEYGLERRALKIDGKYYDEVLMALPLNPRSEPAPRD